MAKGAGGHAAIHAARARQFKAQLDEVDAALSREGFGGGEDSTLAERVAALCGEVRELRGARDEGEWAAAAPARPFAELDDGELVAAIDGILVADGEDMLAPEGRAAVGKFVAEALRRGIDIGPYRAGYAPS